MSSRTITERNLRMAEMVSKDTEIYPNAAADFRELAIKILLADEDYEPAAAFLTAAFRGFKELGLVDETAVNLVKKGLESLGVAVLNS